MCKLFTEKKEEEEKEVVILTHPQIPDVLLLPVNGPRYAKNVWSAGQSTGSLSNLIVVLSQLLGGSFQRLALNISEHLTDGERRFSNSSCAHKKRLTSYIAAKFACSVKPK